MLTPREYEFALIDLAVSGITDPHYARAMVNSMTPEQEQVVRDMIAEKDAEKEELLGCRSTGV